MRYFIYVCIAAALVATTLIGVMAIDMTSTGDISNDKEMIMATYQDVYTTLHDYAVDTYTSVSNFIQQTKTTLEGAYNGIVNGINSVFGFVADGINWLTNLFTGGNQ